MMFDAFCRAHGLLVDGIEAGRWVRVPTEDHPRTRNGAYKYLGDVGFVQNHATMTEVAVVALANVLAVKLASVA